MGGRQGKWRFRCSGMGLSSLLCIYAHTFPVMNREGKEISVLESKYIAVHRIAHCTLLAGLPVG